MADKKSSEPSPESIARANRQRVAAQEGLQAMADVERNALAVRKNMQRLRALREAKQAEAIKNEAAADPAAAKPKRKKAVAKKRADPAVVA
jgi:hypothetical protein